MTRQSIAELVEAWRSRYLRATRKEKTKILDELVALTGYHRKAAIRLLRNGQKPQPGCAGGEGGAVAAGVS